jgi:23S rRNA pseudouridine1911/1915/1917 synthase
MNQGWQFKTRLPERAAGTTVLDWLSREHKHSSREEWQARIEEGRVTLDQQPAKPTDLLHPGQQLTWSRPPWEEPEVPLHYDVIHEDEHLLVVDKPSGLPTMPAGGFYEHTLFSLIRARDAKWSPVHRLGRGTSGLVVFTSPQASPELSRAFRDGEIEKRYLAHVTGTLTPQTISAPIGRVQHGRMGELYAVNPEGRRAETIVERVTGSQAQVRILTGRPHQIRIHLAWVGHPLEGDPLYAAHGALLDAKPSDLGYRLRAYELVLNHPMSGARLRLHSVDVAPTW